MVHGGVRGANLADREVPWEFLPRPRPYLVVADILGWEGGNEPYRPNVNTRPFSAATGFSRLPWREGLKHGEAAPVTWRSAGRGTRAKIPGSGGTAGIRRAPKRVLLFGVSPS